MAVMSRSALATTSAASADAALMYGITCAINLNISKADSYTRSCAKKKHTPRMHAHTRIFVKFQADFHKELAPEFRQKTFKQFLCYITLAELI